MTDNAGGRGAVANHDIAGGSDNRAGGAETVQSAYDAGSLGSGSAAQAAGSYSLSPVGAVRAVPATGETPAAGLGLPAVAGLPSSPGGFDPAPPVFAVQSGVMDGSNSPPAGHVSAGGLLDQISQECEAASAVSPTTDAAPPPAIPAAEGRGSSALGGGTNADWPDADIALLRRLWAEGLPTREIAAELGRTKNAVIGKANRLPLPARPDPNKWRRKNALKPRVKQPMALLLDPQKIGQENGSIRGGPRNRDMRALPIPRGQHGPARSCQWPTTDCKPWRFCEAVTVAGYSYCAGHKKMAFHQREQVAA